MGILFLNAEVSQAYAQFVREVCAGALTVSCANGMIGYVCTRDQVREGGYEPVGSATYFALEGTFSEETEQQVRHAITTLIQEEA